jgi:Na+/citrate or Na+/malate symporter
MSQNVFFQCLVLHVTLGLFFGIMCFGLVAHIIKNKTYNHRRGKLAWKNNKHKKSQSKLLSLMQYSCTARLA